MHMSKKMTLKQYIELAKTIKEKYEKKTTTIKQPPSYSNPHPKLMFLPKFY